MIEKHEKRLKALLEDLDYYLPIIRDCLECDVCGHTSTECSKKLAENNITKLHRFLTLRLKKKEI